MNQLRMNDQETIRGLRAQGWSLRRIAREFGYSRKTVRKYAKCPGVLTGSGESEEAKGPGVLTGAEETSVGKYPGVLTGSQSKCRPFGEEIEEKVERGWSAVRIRRHLVREHGFEGSYDSVQRFIKRHKHREPERVWRMECEPGEEAQVDYGTMRVLENERGNLVNVHVFRITLSHSRKSYTEAVRRQSTESFIRSLENAFRHFGGVPRRLCLDNLKAAVLKADWYDPDITPKLRSFAEHYNLLIMPTRPYSPQHKGKVESGIKYVQNDVLKGSRFRSLAELNARLREWESSVADRRIHGTTKKQVHSVFATVEKAALQELPASLFASFEEGQRSVHRDCYVEVARSYYHVPVEYLRQRVVVRWNESLVWIYNTRMEQLAVHRRLEPGQYSEVLGVEGTRGSVLESALYYRKRLAELGEGCARWADQLIEQGPDHSIRRMQGLLAIKNHSPEQLDQACSMAALHGQYRLRDIRNWLDAPQQQESFSFLEQHELIRELTHYSAMGASNVFHQTSVNP
jgi:transposase